MDEENHFFRESSKTDTRNLQNKNEMIASLKERVCALEQEFHSLKKDEANVPILAEEVKVKATVVDDKAIITQINEFERNVNMYFI